MITLAKLTPGSVAHVAGFSGRRDACLRLMEMGLTQGAPVEVLRRGTPPVFRVRSARLSLSADLADLVEVN